MELDEIKNAWLALGEKLDQKEKLSDIIIREMYQTKVKKSVNTLLNYEYISVITCLIALPFVGWQISIHTGLLFYIALGYWGLFAIAAAIWSLKKAVLLMKIDEVGVVKENVRTVNTYAVWIHKEKFYVFLFGVIGLIPILIIHWQYAKLWNWLFMTALFALAILSSIWGYKRLYARNIRSIQQNLNELQDLED